MKTQLIRGLDDLIDRTIGRDDEIQILHILISSSFKMSSWKDLKEIFLVIKENYLMGLAWSEIIGLFDLLRKVMITEVSQGQHSGFSLISPNTVLQTFGIPRT